MEEITIRYWSPHGRQEETKFHREHSKIDLIMRAAKRIDLSDVRMCTSLQTLDLSHNMLEELDLTPLTGCSLLKQLRIRSNHLTRLDLWPLLDCMSLSEIDISENRLQNLDLSPVFLRSSVRADSSVVLSADALLHYVFTQDELNRRFQLVRGDGAPWTAHPVIIWMEYADLAHRIEWNSIKKRIDSLLCMMTEDNWFGVQRGLLSGLGMEELAGFDGNPKQLLKGTDGNMSFKDARRVVFDNAIELLEEQLENGGPTLFLDTDRMRETRASKLIPGIAERRKQEVEEVILPVKGSKVNLETLWMTHYGFEILKALRLDLTTNLEGLHIVRTSFEELGMEIQTQKASTVSPAYPVTVSRSMYLHSLNYIQGKYD
ncbi:MAG: hypothetical protein C4K48_04320 [Candidatus Thorarchaeota archaeon]|nr:MAG: hypothetical protein C4K48_04320 [Candidatus Thorarchaeota archaeon]